MADESLVSFAEGVKLVTRQDNYLKPSSFWDASTILGDLSNIATQVNRAEYLKEFIDNSKIIFSKDNLNKIEAVYGFRVRESIENAIIVRINSVKVFFCNHSVYNLQFTFYDHRRSLWG